MGSRRDALTAFAELALAVEQIGIAHNPDGRATIGMAQVIPGSRNVVPGAWCSVEFRHPQSRRWKRWNRRCIAPPKRWRRGVTATSSAFLITRHRL
jgi:hypothetical protein